MFDTPAISIVPGCTHLPPAISTRFDTPFIVIVPLPSSPEKENTPFAPSIVTGALNVPPATVKTLPFAEAGAHATDFALNAVEPDTVTVLEPAADQNVKPA